MMTLDDAIKHAEEVAEEKQNKADNLKQCKDYGNPKSTITSGVVECETCADEHRQLAEWLKDYKRLIEQNEELQKENDDFKNYIDLANHTNSQLIQLIEKHKINRDICEDCVSRQAVFEEIPVLWNGKGDKDYCMETLRDFVSELPPVTPTKSWIPVSERLPEDYQRVLVTIVNYAGYKVVRVAEYNSGKKTFQIKENNERWKVGEKGLLAWQPLPDPYE